jgi:hypothetical protein
MTKSTLAVALAAAAFISACGDDKGSPTAPADPLVPQIAGVYSHAYYERQWIHQVLRLSDGFTTSFNCSGSITLVQQPAAGGQARLTGFAVVGAPCPALSFDLTGGVSADGAVWFTTGGPKPPEGPCPAGANVAYSGTVSGTLLSARGVTSVQCPTYGEHRFTYIFTASRR